MSTITTWNTELVWTAEEIIHNLNGQCLHDQDWQAHGISIDCRTLNPRDLFIAIQGTLHDGHDYVAEAFEAGAVAAVVMRQPQYVSSNMPLIYVEDTLRALESLGEAGRSRAEARVIAVTGSGQMTIKSLLGPMLNACGKNYLTDCSLNNDCMASLALARLPRHAHYGVFELSMNNPGELAMLSRRVKPHIALITTVAPLHREFFDSGEVIADMQGEIFSSMPKSGIAILDRDSPQYHRLANLARSHGVKKILSFGKHSKCDARLLSCSRSEQRLNVVAFMLGQQFQYQVIDSHENAGVNSVGALLAALVSGGDAEACSSALGITQTPYKLAI